MDYERIQKPDSQGGGVSPSKLRLMLLGVEKNRKVMEEEQRLKSRCPPRSADARGVEDRNVSSTDSCKEVDVVSSPSECSTSSERAGGQVVKNCIFGVSRSQELEGVDSDGMPSSAFEFQRAERASHRAAKVPPFSKPAPSKWDDAQKWIASPTSNRGGKGGAHTKRDGCRMAATKVVVEAVTEPDTKRIDVGLVKKEGGWMKAANCLPDPPPVADAYTKSAVFVQSSSTPDAAINRNQHESSVSGQSSTAFIQPPSTVRSVSMRDMGTEMTPIASQEPSRSGTPARASTPIRSPSSSRPSSPGRLAPDSTSVEFTISHGDGSRKDLSEKELQLKTRREIMVLGTKLGKPNIAAWASREEEEQDASRSLSRSKNVSTELPEKNSIEIRASAWEEAEKAKYLARYKREEIKIHAWENHQKAKAEAEMRKTEVDVERMRVRAHEKLKDRLASIRQKAEAKRIAAEAKRNQQAAETAEQVEYIRRTGRIPSLSWCWGWCS